MFNSSQNKEATWQVLQYFTSPEALDLFVEITGMVPPHREVLVERWLPSTTMPENRHVYVPDGPLAWPLDNSVFSVIQQWPMPSLGDEPSQHRLSSWKR